MLQEVIDLQNAAVNSLVCKTEEQDIITFKSPTGSGKTFMMADFMNRVLTDNSDTVFLVSSLSKGNLAKQNYDKFVEYSDSRIFDKINPYLINSETAGENRLYIPTEYNVYVLPRDLYKDKSKLKQGALLDFLRAVTTKKPLGLEKKIYVIKDECHIATSNLDSLSHDYFSKVFNFSATPKLQRGQKPDVEIKELDAVNCKLIKAVSYQDENETVGDAFDKFEKIKEKYILLGINPCIIIQISNKEKADEEIEKIQLELSKRDLKWMLIVDNDKKCDTNDVFKAKKIPVDRWKDYAKTNTATIDVIIFKMVITEGWDIPRACMLYQIRDSKSKQLDEQVIGRIRRNPCLLNYEKLSDEAKELIGTAYVWGIKPKEAGEIHEVRLAGSEISNETQAEIKLRTTRLKRPMENTTFDIENFLCGRKKTLIPSSIFSLYKKYQKTTNEVKDMYDAYVDTPSKWFAFMENIDDISTESKNIVCDYSKNMELVEDEVSFPLISYYVDGSDYKNIGNWIWQRSDGNEKFSFDSEAERKWAKILLDLARDDKDDGERVGKQVSIQTIVDGEKRTIRKYLVGKNYPSNSQIKFEYYLNGIHSSYPDFIMKDWNDRIHIFETKSVNKSNNLKINAEEYEEKIEALKKAYRYASKLTGYLFYIPILSGDDWIIFRYANGEEKIISLRGFEKEMKN